MYNQRKEQLQSLGFTLDGAEPFPTWQHPNETWICDFALEQYSKKEWDGFLNDFEFAKNDINPNSIKAQGRQPY